MKRDRGRHTDCQDCLRPGVIGEHPAEPLVYLSFRRLCVECAIARSAAAGRQMHEKSGPEYEHWLEAMRRFASNA